MRKAWDHHKEGWARAYFVLLNNGKLKYYESAGAAGMPVAKRVELEPSWSLPRTFLEPSCHLA